MGVRPHTLSVPSWHVQRHLCYYISYITASADFSVLKHTASIEFVRFKVYRYEVTKVQGHKGTRWSGGIPQPIPNVTHYGGK
jgi:hypothetical protein